MAVALVEWVSGRTVLVVAARVSAALACVLEGSELCACTECKCISTRYKWVGLGWREDWQVWVEKMRMRMPGGRMFALTGAQVFHCEAIAMSATDWASAWPNVSARKCAKKKVSTEQKAQAQMHKHRHGRVMKIIVTALVVIPFNKGCLLSGFLGKNSLIRTSIF